MSLPVALVKGQNITWPHGGLLVEVQSDGARSDVAHPGYDVSALLVGDDQRVRSSDDFVFYNQPAAPGVVLESNPRPRVRLDLAALRTAAVLCLVSVDPTSPTMGSLGRLTAVLSDPAGTAVARFTLSGLTDERAVIAVEVYRRGTTWKVRAVAQGYAGGLAEAVTAHGVEVDDTGPPVAEEVPPGARSAASASQRSAPDPGAPPPPGTSDQERLFRQAAGIFEDAARSTASLRSSLEYAGRKRDAALDDLLADPGSRVGVAAHPATAAAQAEHDRLVEAAGANHRRDMAHLHDELLRYEASLPPSMAPWSSRVWQRWQPATQHSVAVRVGDLHVEEAPGVELPMLLAVPLRRPLWVDTTTDPGDLAARMVRAIVARLLAAYPPGGLTVSVVDLGGGLASALAPIAKPGSRVMPAPAAGSLTAMQHLLDEVAKRVDLVKMARSAGALDALGGDTAERLVVVHDFPTAFDDATVGKVRYLVDEGAAAGVQLLFTGEQSPVMGGATKASTLFRDSMRLPVLPDDHIADGWTGTTWNYTPDLGPDDARVLEGMLQQAAGVGGWG